MSIALSLVSIGIYLFTSDLRKPSLESILLCFGPILSLPAFLTALWSRRWHRRIMWLLACVTYSGIVVATLEVRSSVRPHLGEAASIALVSGVQPLVIASIIIAVLSECSYHLKRRVPERDLGNPRIDGT